MDVDVDVDTDAASDELRESAFLKSADVVTGGFWLNMGKALACSTLTSVLAWALGGVAPNPRRAKLIVRDIFDVLAVDGGFKDGFLGETFLVDTGLTGVASPVGLIFRGNECGEWSRSDCISCSLNRVTDLADSRSCRPDA